MDLSWSEHGTGLVALGVLVASLALEAVALRWRWTPYAAVTVPLGEDLAALPRAPPGEGRYAGVAWAAVDDVDEGQVLWFWSTGGRGVPRGLHGVVHLLPDRAGRVQLDVRWAPPWTPILALGVLSVVGLQEGAGAPPVVLATGLLAVLLVSFRAAARVAAAQLRQGLVEALEGQG